MGQIETVALRLYETICKLDIQWEASVYHRKLSFVLCGDLEGGMEPVGVGGRLKQEGP